MNTFQGAATWLYFQLPPKIQFVRLYSAWRVSSHGRVQNTNGIIHWGYLRPDGYRTVQVRVGNAPRQVFVHRMVAHYFLDPPANTQQWMVNHIDGNRGNNHKFNLEYATASQNSLHAKRNGTHRSAPSRAKPVLARLLNASVWTLYCSAAEASRQLGVNTGCISRCCRNLQNFAQGFEFKFADIPEAKLSGEEWRAALHPSTGLALSGWEVSSHGRIKNTLGIRHCGWRSDSGYYTATAHGQKFLVHRLVARTFHGPPPTLAAWLVHHKDASRGNNHVSNLEYVTPAQNVAHHISMRGSGPRLSGATRSKPILVRPVGSLAFIPYPSLQEASRDLGVDTRAISGCCKGKKSSAGGFQFKYDHAKEPPQLVDEDWHDAKNLAALVSSI